MSKELSAAALLLAFITTLCGGCAASIAGHPSGKPAPPVPSIDPITNQSQLCQAGISSPRTAFFLTLSGGGSRSAYFGARVLSELKNVDGSDLTGHIDVISSVSGGSLAAALYGISSDPGAEHTWRPTWDDTLIRQRLAVNLKTDMAKKLANPIFLGSYLFGNANRTDTLFSAINNDVLYGADGSKRTLTLGDFNPRRPEIILNATVATAEGSDAFMPRPFGSLFTFSPADLDSVGVDYSSFPLAYAVAASSAFPGLLSPVAIHRYSLGSTEQVLGTPRYLHLMDGGNVDNLGLLAVKRALIENSHRLLTQCDQVVVVTVDAFGAQGLHQDDQPIKHSVSGWFLDSNTLLASFDELLAANRTRLLAEFKSRMFTPPADSEQCRKDDLPQEVCDGGVRVDWDEVNALLKKKLYFVHLSFDSPETAGPSTVTLCLGSYGSADQQCTTPPVDLSRFDDEEQALRTRLKRIPTTFGLSAAQQSDITAYTKLLFNPKNVCVMHLQALVIGSVQHTNEFYKKATKSCDETASISDEVLSRPRNTEEAIGDWVAIPGHETEAKAMIKRKALVANRYVPLSTIAQREAFWATVLKYYGWNGLQLSRDQAIWDQIEVESRQGPH